MAYTVTYDGDFLFDPYGDDVITDSSISGEVNAAVYFDFTIASNHRLYNKIEEKAGIVRVYSDSKLLFMGEITDIQEDFYGSKQVSCVDPRDHLNDVLLRPYSTVSGEQSITAPSSVDGYFQWLIDKYNEGTINPKFHFQVGVNQGAYLEKNNYIYRSSEQFPSVGSELEDKILDTLGGYLTLTYPDDIPTLNLYADVHEANTQMIDFGVNLIDFTKTTGTSEQYTAIRPEGGTPEKDSDDPDAPDPKPTTIESLGDGVTSVDGDYVKKGDVVYCQSAVNRYGYREYSWNESDTTDPNDLLEKAVADLKKKVEPKLTLEVKAVDMALFMEGYDHLECGQVARVRSKPHDVDEYLLVSSMDIDLQDPSQTKYTLGQAFDSLTGEQSSFVKSLNAGINSSLDAVAGLDQTMKDQAVLVGQAVSDASNAVSVAGEAQSTANGAQQAAQNAQQAAQNAQSTADKAIGQIQGVGELVDQIQEMVDNIDADVDGAKQQASEAAQRADEASKKADAAAAKADSFQQQITDVTTTVNGVEQNVTELSTQVSGAVENADEALTQVSQTKTDLEGFKASVSQTYTTKQELDDAIEQEVLDRNAAIEVGIDGISATVSSNYTELTGKVNAAQSDADAALKAAQSNAEDLTNFANEVSGDLNDLQSQIDGSIQTWFYSGVPTLANQPANQWTDSATRNNHLGDLYYDTSTGYAYRFMLQNSAYSWGRITDSDVTKALQNAAKAQDTADNKRRVFVTTPKPPYDVGDLWVQGSGGDIKRCQTAKTSSQSYAAADWVLASKYTDDSALDDYKDVVATTYATKSSVTQTANEIRAEVSESYQVKGNYATSDDLDDAIAQEVLDRNSAISQSASKVQSTVSQTYTTKTEASAIEDKADAAQSTANAAKTSASNAQNTANTANSTANSTKNDLNAYKTTVSNTYATKTSVTQTANSIKSEVAAEYTTKKEFEGLEIGGRNLIPGTATWDGTLRSSNNVTIDGDTAIMNKTGLPTGYAVAVEPGETLTVSCDVRADQQNSVTGSPGILLIEFMNANVARVSYSYVTGTFATSWKRISKTFIVPNNASIEYVCVAPRNANNVASVYFRHLKLERGNRATDWSPAPEDMLSTADASTTYATKTSLTQTEDRITSEVSKTYQTKSGMSSYATKSYVDQQDSSIKTTVSSVQATANSALTKATTVEQTADGLEVKITSAVSTANTAKSTADSAKTAATNAQNTASTAKSTADSAKSTATTANNTANSAKSTATAAQNTANAAKKQVYHSATGTAGTAGYVRFATVKFTSPYMNRPVFFALSNRGWPQSNVWVQWSNVNSTDPSLASIKADGGLNVWAHKTGTSTWEIIVQKSEGYDTIYVNDYSNNNSGCTVSWVNVQLSSVPSGSTQATRLAGKRNSSDIDNAAKTATNYLKFDSSGLCVGNHTGTLGYNTLIKSTGVDIRNGSTVLSSFGASLVELGRNSASSQVKMCGGQASISCANDTMTLRSSLSVDINGGAYANLDARQVNITASQGTATIMANTGITLNSYDIILYGNTSIGKAGTTIHGVYAGSKTIHPSNTWPTLFTNSQYTSIVGRAYNGSKDVVLVQNGNSAAANIQVIQAFYNPNSNEVCVSLSAAVGSVQIQYLIVAGA